MRFIVLISFLFSFTAEAYVAEALARTSARLFNASCESFVVQKRESLSPVCTDSRLMAVPEAQGTMKDVEISLHFAQLASLRREDQICAKAVIDDFNSDAKFATYATDVENKVGLIANLMIELVHGQNRLNQFALQLKSYQGKQNSEKINQEMQELREQNKKKLAAMAAVENSILLSGQSDVNEFVRAQILELTEEGVTAAGLGAADPLRAKKIDSRKFQESLRAALRKTKASVDGDVKILDVGIQSQGHDLSRPVRESLAQDHDLVEKYVALHPGVLQGSRLLCEVDATYGAGAQRRDQAMMVGSIGLALASGGLGIAVRGAAVSETAVSAAFATSRLSLARGLLSTTSARVLASLAMGLNVTNGAKEIDNECGKHSHEVVKVEGPRCEKFSVQSLAKDNCILSWGLLGLGVASPLRMFLKPPKPLLKKRR